ncbi:hypothetical protein LshimejAT787_0804780 [Lyophyllum shimeji]|uniref:Uncharacterized protein n=1 Tax=Lyophyllum shimeji TaxID=47721 RepID=A0A9P3PSL6_LYOSH|nr:hypothetical protein LshimejAT787_0804780 [Lyophyllum shimeji]
MQGIQSGEIMRPRLEKSAITPSIFVTVFHHGFDEATKGPRSIFTTHFASTLVLGPSHTVSFWDSNFIYQYLKSAIAFSLITATGPEGVPHHPALAARLSRSSFEPSFVGHKKRIEAFLRGG